MQIGKFMFPDRCTKGCKLANDFAIRGQSSLCIRCPVMNCGNEAGGMRPEEYREDWAEEWDKFFKTGDKPVLYF